MGQCKFEVKFKYSVCLPILQRAVISSTKCIELTILFFSFLALQPPLGVVFYSPLAGFSLLAYEVS